MRDSRHEQVFTVFGGSYIAEDHGNASLPLHEGGKRSLTKAAIVAGLLAFGATTATAMKAPRVFGGFWSNNAHATWMVAGFEDAVY